MVSWTATPSRRVVSFDLSHYPKAIAFTAIPILSIGVILLIGSGWIGYGTVGMVFLVTVLVTPDPFTWFRWHDFRGDLEMLK